MPFDANLVLLDGSFDLTPTTDISPTSLTRSPTTGFAVIDIGGTTRPKGDAEGVSHLVATMVLPTAPTTYGDDLTMYIEQSDNLTFAWMFCGDFHTLYALTRIMDVTITTAFVAADIGAALTSASGDVGLLRWMHPDALTIGKTCKMIISMAGAGDTYDLAGEQVSGGTTGVGNVVAPSWIEPKPRMSGPNTFSTAFSMNKRYVRICPTASPASNWGKVQVLLSPHPFKRI